MNGKPLSFPTNVPILLAIQDPEGVYDSDLRQGNYETTTGQSFALPRPAVILLNQLEPRPGEEITITKHWKGTSRSPFEWTICLSPRSEQFRASEEMAQDGTQEPSELTGVLVASIQQETAKRPLAEPPSACSWAVSSAARFQSTPRKKGEPRAEYSGPELKRTGTDGPVPLPDRIPPVPAIAAAPRRLPPDQIPCDVAVREILEFIAKDPGTAGWSDQARQDLASTVLIAEYKANRIARWRRE